MKASAPAGSARAPFRGPLLTLASVFLWGAQPLAITLTVGHVPGSTLAFYKILTACAALAPLAFRHGLPDPRARGRGPALLLLCTALALALSYVAYNECFRYISPGNAQVYFLLSRVFLALGGIFLFHESFRPAQWGGFAILFAGILLFFRDQLANADGSGYLVGVALVLAAALAWAGFAVGQKKLLGSFTAGESLFALYLVCTIFLSPWASLSPLRDMGALELGAVLFICASNVLAFYTFSLSLKYWEATKIGAVSCLTPIATITLGLVASLLNPARFAPEHLRALSLAGAGFAIAGASVVALFGARKIAK